MKKVLTLVLSSMFLFSCSSTPSVCECLEIKEDKKISKEEKKEILQKCHDAYSDYSLQERIQALAECGMLQ